VGDDTDPPRDALDAAGLTGRVAAPNLDPDVEAAVAACATRIETP
jgi:hypothetical protein